MRVLVLMNVLHLICGINYEDNVQSIAIHDVSISETNSKGPFLYQKYYLVIIKF